MRRPNWPDQILCAVDDMRAYGDPFGDTGPCLPDGAPPNRYGAPRYLPRGKRLA